MPLNVLRVSLERTLRDYDNMMPPFQPMGDEDDEEPKVPR
jgi:hypothetical protein